MSARRHLRPWWRLRTLLVVLLALLAAAWTYLLQPDVQRGFALQRLAPLVDEVAIDYLHVTPWSLELRGLRLVERGALLQMSELRASFNPLLVLAHTVSVRTLSLRGVVDLRHFESTPYARTPFPGVLALIEQDVALGLTRSDANLQVLLPGDHVFELVAGGGGFAPLRTGSLDFALRYAGPAGPGELDLRGRINAAQIKRGRLQQLDLDVTTNLAVSASAPPQPLRLTLAVTHDPAAASPTAPGSAAPPPAELLEAVLEFGTDAHTRLALRGRYIGTEGAFVADYRLDTDQRLPALWTGATALPALASKSTGRLLMNAGDLSGTVTFTSHTAATALERVLGVAPTVPTALALNVDATGSFDATQFTLASLTIGAADTPRFERITAVLGEPMTVPYAAPLSVLEVPRKLATLEVGPLPLAWFAGLAAGHGLSGELVGSYAVIIDEQQRYRLEPRAATLASDVRVTAPAVTAAAAASAAEATAAAHDAAGAGAPPITTLIEGLSVSLRPTASWSTDFIRYALNEVVVTVGRAELGRLEVKVASRQGQPAPRAWRYRVDGSVDYDALSKVPVVAAQVAGYPLPAGLAASFKALVAQRAQAVTIETADALVSAPAHPEVLRLHGLRPFHLNVHDGAIRLSNATGELATLATRGMELAWLNPLLPDLTLGGRLASADFKLSARAAGSLHLEPVAPLALANFSLAQAGRPLLDEVALSLTPVISYDATGTRATLTGLVIRSRGATLVSGTGDVAIEGLADADPALRAAGRLTLDLTAASAQPALGWRDALPDLPITAELDFALTAVAGTLTAERLRVEFAVGPQARAVLEAEPGLAIRARLGAGENLARAFVGAAALDVRDVSSDTLGQFVPLGGMRFAELSSQLRVRSDGKVLHANTLAPLGVERVSIFEGTREQVREFSLLSAANLRITRREVHLELDDLALRFAAGPATPAVAGGMRAEFMPGKLVPLSRLTLQLKADLPQLLAQPGVLPGHHLERGSLALAVSVDPSRRIAAGVLLDDLAAAGPLAVDTFELPLSGELAADGRGFDLQAPLVGRGRSGPSNATVTAHYAPQPDEPRVLRLDITSELFYLNDILASIAAISPSAPDEDAPAAKRVHIELDRTPDDKAAWKVVPAAVVIDLHVDKLYYSDYLAFTDVGGNLDVRSRKFALKGIRARFHDSALKFDGAVRFKAGQPEPYTLELAGTLADFDLNQFFRELIPGQKPRIQGLFGGEIKAFGAFPNMQQWRNDVLFDVRLRSRDGLFRPLPPDSGLLIGASDVLGLVGEGLSYVPTGGFGAGAIARLVNYIARIDYDTVDIHLLRDERRDVIVEQFQVLSPTIAMTVVGGITYVEGKDILDSPLELTGSLDMLGRGAAILYSMDLMQDEQNALGYWKGPEFRVWGTPAEAQSNFDEVIQQAGDGTLKGAILRPISGLIGNLKYRWFNRDSRAREALQEARREERAALAAAAAGSEDAAPADDAPGAAPSAP